MERNKERERERAEIPLLCEREKMRRQLRSAP
jgi:hypothetical protein